MKENQPTPMRRGELGELGNGNNKGNPNSISQLSGCPIPNKYSSSCPNKVGEAKSPLQNNKVQQSSRDGRGGWRNKPTI